MVYLSGPMTGLPNFNHEAFNKAAEYFRSQNKEVFNPAEVFGGDTTHLRSEYMRLEIQALLYSTELVMLPGWENSKGALLELQIAEELEMPISFITTLQIN
jgi:hypothetical protein